MQTLLNALYNIKDKQTGEIRKMTGAESIAMAILQTAMNPKNNNWANAVKYAMQLSGEDKSKLEKELIKANKDLIKANKNLIEARISELKAAALDQTEVEDDKLLEALEGTAAADWSGDDVESEDENEEA